MIKYCLHIGIEKCASTYLKQHIFPQWGSVIGINPLRKYKYNYLYEHPKEVNIISSEVLWRNTFVTDALVRGFDAKILMFVRDQRDFDKAYYIQKLTQEAILPDPPKIDNMVDYYVEKYGYNILVLQLDHLKMYPEYTISRIAEFWGLPEINAPNIILNKTIKSRYKVRLLEIIYKNKYLCRKFGGMVKKLPEIGKDY